MSGCLLCVTGVKMYNKWVISEGLEFRTNLEKPMLCLGRR